MIKDLRHTFKQAAIYGFSNILVKATGLILLPIYTSALSVEDYGILVVLEIITQFFVGVISFNLPASMLRFGSDEENPKAQSRIYFTALVLLLGFVAAFLLLFLPLTGVFSRAILDSSEYSHYFTLLFCSIAIEILSILPMQLMRLREQSMKYLGFFLIKLVGLCAFVWYFVSVKEWGVYGAILGILLGNLSLFLATFTLQIRQITFDFDKEKALGMYRFGAPLVFTTIAGILLTIADRAIIKYYGEFSDVGIYGLAYKIGSLSNLLIIASFSLGFLPIAYKKFHEPNFNRFFSKIFTYFIGLTALLTLGISVFGKEVIKILSSDEPDYWIAIVLIPFIAYAFIFKAIQNYLAYAFMLTKQTRYHATITIIGVLINITLNFTLIPLYDMYGAIAATGISYAVMGFITYRIAQRKLPIPYEIGRVAGLLLLCAVFIAGGIYINDLEIISRLAAKTGLIVLFVIVVYFTILDRAEKGKIAKVIRLLRSPGGFKKVLHEIGLPSA